MKLLSEFKPALIFLGKFLILYLIFNLLYGLYIDSFYPHPDPVTQLVTYNSTSLLQFVGYDVYYKNDYKRPAVNMNLNSGQEILSVYEGCNCFNILIIYLAFLLAFAQKYDLRLLKYIGSGIILIYLANLFRIIGLFLTSMYRPNLMYFMHKYFFTAILYLVVFALWYIWINRQRRISAKHEKEV